MYLSTPTQRLTTLPPADGSSIVPLQPSGRLAHPTNDRDAPDDREEGLDDGPAGRLSFTALRAIVAGLARVQRSVPLGPEDPGTARSVRLLATTFYDVWLITWPDGSGLSPHDHGGARSVMQVVEGELVETFTDHVDRQAPKSQLLHRGDVTKTTPSSVHEIANRSGGDATTIHVYSPPLADIGLFSLRVPEASSRDLPPPRPGRRRATLRPVETAGSRSSR